MPPDRGNIADSFGQRRHPAQIHKPQDDPQREDQSDVTLRRDRDLAGLEEHAGTDHAPDDRRSTENSPRTGASCEELACAADDVVSVRSG